MQLDKKKTGLSIHISRAMHHTFNIGCCSHNSNILIGKNNGIRKAYICG